MEKLTKSQAKISTLITSLQQKTDPLRLKVYQDLIFVIQSSKKVVEIPNQEKLYEFIKKELS